MTKWVAFAGVVGVVLTLLILLARASQGTVEPSARDDRGGADAPIDRRADEPVSTMEGVPGESAADAATAEPTLPPGTLLANVALTQGLLGAVVVAAAWATRIPPEALGLGRVLDGTPVLVGVGLGVALYVADEAMAAAADTIGIEYAEELREMLAPETPAGWALLLFVVLPVIAGFEELLFRAALIGALSAGFDLSPWLLAVVSTALFALGHGAQGPAGILVTGTLGLALAAAFVLTGSLVAVVVAHYLVNALEFVVHEGVGIEWSGGSMENG